MSGQQSLCLDVAAHASFGPLGDPEHGRCRQVALRHTSALQTPLRSPTSPGAVASFKGSEKGMPTTDRAKGALQAPRGPATRGKADDIHTNGLADNQVGQYLQSRSHNSAGPTFGPLLKLRRRDRVKSRHTMMATERKAGRPHPATAEYRRQNRCASGNTLDNPGIPHRNRPTPLRKADRSESGRRTQVVDHLRTNTTIWEY